MDLVLINKILLILVTAIGAWLGLLVYFNNRKARVNQLFILMIFFALLWIIPCYFAVKLVDNLDLSLFLTRLAYGLAVLFMIPFYFFAIIFLGEKNEPLYLKILVPIGSVLISFFAVSTNFMAKYVTPVKFGLVPVLGGGKFIYFGFVFFIALYVLFRLFKNYLKSSKGEKLKLQYFLLGFSIFVVANLIFNVILPFRQGIPQYYQFGNYSAIFFFGFTAYAIVKRQLFDIKIVLTELLVSVFAILLFIQIFFSDSLFEYIWNSSLFVVFLFFGRSLTKAIFREIRIKEELGEAGWSVLTQSKKVSKNFSKLTEDRDNILKQWFFSDINRELETASLKRRIEELEKKLKESDK